MAADRCDHPCSAPAIRTPQRDTEALPSDAKSGDPHHPDRSPPLPGASWFASCSIYLSPTLPSSARRTNSDTAHHPARPTHAPSPVSAGPPGMTRKATSDRARSTTSDCHPLLLMRMMDRIKAGAKLIVVDLPKRDRGQGGPVYADQVAHRPGSARRVATLCRSGRATSTRTSSERSPRLG